MNFAKVTVLIPSCKLFSAFLFWVTASKYWINSLSMKAKQLVFSEAEVINENLYVFIMTSFLCHLFSKYTHKPNVSFAFAPSSPTRISNYDGREESWLFYTFPTYIKQSSRQLLQAEFKAADPAGADQCSIASPCPALLTSSMIWQEAAIIGEA